MNILETKDVLLLCRISRRTLYDLVKTGDFPAPTMLGKRKRRWLEDEVKAWVAAR